MPPVLVIVMFGSFFFLGLSTVMDIVVGLLDPGHQARELATRCLPHPGVYHAGMSARYAPSPTTNARQESTIRECSG